MTNTTTPQDKACTIASTEDAPRVYVGTYGKYNAGSINGRWLTLTDYEDKQEFLADCYLIHKDDKDPELMFQDWENIPGKYISEGDLCGTIWHEYLTLSDDERELLTMYQNCVDQDGTFEQAQDSYYGAYESEAHFAESLCDEAEVFNCPKWIVIDWESTWTNNLSFDFAAEYKDGEYHIFNSHV